MKTFRHRRRPALNSILLHYLRIATVLYPHDECTKIQIYGGTWVFGRDKLLKKASFLGITFEMNRSLSLGLPS